MNKSNPKSTFLVLTLPRQGSSFCFFPSFNKDLTWHSVEWKRTAFCYPSPSSVLESQKSLWFWWLLERFAKGFPPSYSSSSRDFAAEQRSSFSGSVSWLESTARLSQPRQSPGVSLATEVWWHLTNAHTHSRSRREPNVDRKGVEHEAGDCVCGCHRLSLAAECVLVCVWLMAKQI